MRKSHMAGRLPSDRIIVRAERTAEAHRTTAPATRGTGVRKAPVARTTAPRRGATMDYQMGFTSGPSH
jgi:hypothetical protein